MTYHKITVKGWLVGGVLLALLQDILSVPLGMVVYRAGSLDGLSTSGWERIINTPEVVYVLTQESPPGKAISEKARQSYQLLKKAGKKVILDIWWGPDGDYHWDRFNFPDIAQDERVRAEFFQEVVESVLQAVGVENLYGVHLLEETGLWYGYEKTVHPYYQVPGLQTPSVRRYGPLLRKETGLNLDMAPIWNQEERFAFWRWACRSISSAAAHRVFGMYLKKRHPSLKVFHFEGLPDVATQNFTEYQVMSGWYDGIVTDNYSSPEVTYWLVAYRTMAPQAEIVSLVAGYFGTGATTEVVEKVKEARLAAAVQAGMDGVGFFEPDGKRVKTMDYDDAEIWSFNVAAFRRVREKIKPLQERPLLIIPTNISVGGYGIHEYLPFSGVRNFALIPAAESRLVNLSTYQMVVICGPNYYGKKATWDADYMKGKYKVDSLFQARVLNSYVKEGGLLVISGLPLEKGSGLFLTEEGFIWGQEIIKVNQAIPGTWAREKFSLKEAYGPLFTVSAYNYQTGKDVTELGKNVGFLIPYGKGYCLVLPQRPSGRVEVSEEERINYGKFLHDILSGLGRFAGKENLLSCFSPAS